MAVTLASEIQPRRSDVPDPDLAGPDSTDGLWDAIAVAILADAEREELDALRAATVNAVPSPRRTLQVQRASEISLKETHWVWQGRIPQAALTLLLGREGIGKSTLAYHLAAQVTRGTLPGDLFGQPRNVLIVATEDDWERTILARLIVAGADLDRICRIFAGTGEGELSLPGDVDELRRLIEQENAGLVLLDPIMSRIHETKDTHKDGDVRQALEPLTGIASQTDCAVVGLIHMNKSGATDPLTTMMGSRAFAAVARAVLYVLADPADDKTIRLLTQAKNNLGRLDVPSLRFTIEGKVAGRTATGAEVSTGALVWQGESNLSAEEAHELATRSSEERSATQEAGDWLVEHLTACGGSADSKSITNDARKMGFTVRTLGYARERQGITTKRVGFPAISVWSLPDHEPVRNEP